MTAPFKEYPYQPRFDPDLRNLPDLPDIPWPSGPPPANWPLPFIPKFQNLPSGQQPTIEGYPWWVDPTFLNPLPAPAPPPVPSSPPGPTDMANRSGDVPANWLLSYYNRNLARQAGTPSGDVVDPSALDDASQSGFPERRLGRRTYRA